jgi:hypothetical protein
VVTSGWHEKNGEQFANRATRKSAHLKDKCHRSSLRTDAHDCTADNLRHTTPWLGLTSDCQLPWATPAVKITSTRTPRKLDFNGL